MLHTPKVTKPPKHNTESQVNTCKHEDLVCSNLQNSFFFYILTNVSLFLLKNTIHNSKKGKNGRKFSGNRTIIILGLKLH